MRQYGFKKPKKLFLTFVVFSFSSIFSVFFAAPLKSTTYNLVGQKLSVSSPNSSLFLLLRQTSETPKLSDSQPKKDLFYYIWTWTSTVFKWTTFGISNIASLIVQPFSFLFKGAWLGLGYLGSFITKIFYKPVEALVFNSSNGSSK